MTIYSLDIHTPFPIENQCVVPCPVLLLPDLYTGFSRGRSGGLVCPSPSKFSTVSGDPVKGLGIVSKAEIDIFLHSLAFLMIQRILAIWFLVLLLFLNPAWTSGSSQFMYYWSLSWRILSIMRRVQLCGTLNILWHCLSLGLEWKLTFSSPVATAELSKFAGIFSAIL